jgi:hypothetical protein
MSIAIFLTKIIHKIKSIFLRKVTQKEHCAGSVYHVNVGTLRNKFLVMVSSEDDLLLKFLLLPDAKNHNISIEEFNIGLNNNIITLVESMPKHVLDVCKEQFEHNNEHASN